jgi:putative Holliday junction resolvase
MCNLIGRREVIDYISLHFAIHLKITYNTLMRKLGIDYGTKKIGLALTDESGSMAFPHSVIPTNSDVLKVLVNLISKEKVGEIVIGHSLDRNGKPNAVHSEVESLMLDLTLETGLPIHLQPEQYTTQAAIQLQGKTSMTDAAAAALILDSFITKTK